MGQSLVKQGFHLILGIQALWKLFCDEMRMKLTCALMAGFVEKKHLGVGVFTSTLDSLITALVDNAVQFSLQVSHSLEQLTLLDVVVSVVKADEPPGVDAVKLVVDEAFDIPFQPLGLLAVFLMY